MESHEATSLSTTSSTSLCTLCDRPVWRLPTSTAQTQTTASSHSGACQTSIPRPSSPPASSLPSPPPCSSHPPPPFQRPPSSSSRASLWTPSAASSMPLSSLHSSPPPSGPPSSPASFVMVARMADMNMSYIHVQEAAAAAISPSSVTATSNSSPRPTSYTGLFETSRRAEMVLEYGAGKIDSDAPACSHCLNVMLQGLDKELAYLTEEEGRYNAVITQKGAPSFPPSLPPSLTFARSAAEDAVKALQEEEEVSRGEEESLREKLRFLSMREREVRAREEEFWDALCRCEEDKWEDEEGVEEMLREVERLHARAEALQRPGHAVLKMLLFGRKGGREGGREGGKGREEEALVALEPGGSSGGGETVFRVHGLRVARREDPRRDLWWAEINAAWGRVVLLVIALVHAVGFEGGGEERGEEPGGGRKGGRGRYRAVYMGGASRIVQDPGKKSQLTFPLFVVEGGRLGGKGGGGRAGGASASALRQQQATRMDEGVRRLCLLVTEIQKHVLTVDEGERALALEQEERLFELDVASLGLGEERGWNVVLRRLAGALNWLVWVVCEGVGGARGGEA
ncbi:hypothetical protein Naga_100479g3 [Nannochloropsis gaditana]|nr:hypothetical protein Naga_100479g3 [Nannochloropsis gaditana]